ncbi:MAG: (deoxy)nucleoside triphosphate pyrophosphohydrolase [Myxococcota bacterium]
MATTIRVAAAVIEKDGKYLITQRRDEAVLPLLWEFPGGKVELGENDESALKRELRERLDADVEVVRKLGETHHAYEGYWVVMAMYQCLLKSPELRVCRVRAFKWVGSDELDQHEFPPADQTTIEKLLGLQTKPQ